MALGSSVADGQPDPSATIGDANVVASGVPANAVAIVLAALLLLDSFFDWLGVRASVGPVEVAEAGDAWHFAVCALAVGIGALAAVPAVLRLCRIDVPAALVVAMGGVAFALVLTKLVVGSEIDTGGFDVEIEKTREVGIFLGLALTAGIAGTGVVQLLAERRPEAR